MFNKLTGETITEISGAEEGSDQVIIKTKSGKTFTLYHDQDCCEHVRLYDVVGNPQDLVGHVVNRAEEVESPKENVPDYNPSESGTWTFYHINAGLTYVTLRWLGESNGYYSESVYCSVDE